MIPPLVYIGGRLDRVAQRRADDAWIARLQQDDATCVLPVWRDRNLLISGTRPVPAVLRGDDGRCVLADAEANAFLGLDEAGTAWFAALVRDGGEAGVVSRYEGATFEDIGKVATTVDAADGAMLAYARALMRWHRCGRFCGSCGAPMLSRDAGHLRECSDEDCGVKQFPRTDPVAIMLVSRPDGDGGSCLLARQPGWMPGLMSTLAGFVEPGESLEDAVRREIREEAGIDVTSVSYVTSQPWPFPSSLMLGFRAVAAADAEIDFDTTELETARWVRRSEMANLRALGIRLPFRGTIARALIEGWLADDASL